MTQTALEMLALADSRALNIADYLVPIVCDDVMEWYWRRLHAVRRRTEIPGLTALRLRPPWRRTWLDMSVPGHPELRLAAEVWGGTSEEIAALLEDRLRSFGEDFTGSWPSSPYANALGGYLVFVGQSGAAKLLGCFLQECDEKWQMGLPRAHAFTPSGGDLGTSPIWVGLVLHTLGLLHVKNTELVDLPVSRQLRRKAERERRPAVQFKELVIAPLRHTLRLMRQWEKENPGQPLPLHLCMGHYKTFTEKRPLFGRLTGTYWWDPHLKGSYERGVNVSDHRLVTHG